MPCLDSTGKAAGHCMNTHLLGSLDSSGNKVIRLNAITVRCVGGEEMNGGYIVRLIILNV